MPLDPINPVGPRPAAQPGAIPTVRRVERTGEDHREPEDQGGRRRRRPATLPDLPPPPDDGRPHVDVRV